MLKAPTSHLVRVGAVLAVLFLSACGERERPAKAEKPATPTFLPGDAAEQAKEGDIEKVKEAIGRSPDLVGARDDEGETLLLHAAASGKPDVVQLLLLKGADPKVANDKGVTPLYLAASQGNKEVAKLLLEKGADPNAKTKEGDAPLHAATNHLKDLPEHPGCVEAVRLLLAAKAEPNIRNRLEETPLHIAAQRGHRDIAELLLTYKADHEARAALYKETPLHRAAVYNHRDVVEILLAAGADINAKDAHGRTPLARARHMRHRELADFLREKGGTP